MKDHATTGEKPVLVVVVRYADHNQRVFYCVCDEMKSFVRKARVNDESLMKRICVDLK